MKEVKTMENLVDQIIAYESGEMTESEMIEFFQSILDSKLVWILN
jgi:hypothetical protein